MPTETTQQQKYKICTPNCTQYSAEKGKLPCKKATFAFRPPVGRECTFSLLEGQAELAQTTTKSTEPQIQTPYRGPCFRRLADWWARKNPFYNTPI